MNWLLLPIMRFAKEGRGYIWTDTGVGVLCRENLDAKLDIRVAARLLYRLDCRAFIFGCIFIARRLVHVCVYIYSLISQIPPLFPPHVLNGLVQLQSNR